MGTKQCPLPLSAFAGGNKVDRNTKKADRTESTYYSCKRSPVLTARALLYIKCDARMMWSMFHIVHLENNEWISLVVSQCSKLI